MDITTVIDTGVSESLASDTENTNQYGWTKRIEKVLDMVRVHCSNLSDYHNYKYQNYKSRLLYFRVPLIVLSAINAFAAVGLQPYMKQTSISTMNSSISLICGVITSIELFLNIQKKMESELSSHKDYYILSVQIFKVISMDRSQRKIDGRTFLDSKFAEYEKLIQNSNVSTNDFTGDVFTQPKLLSSNMDKSESDIADNTKMVHIIPKIPNILYNNFHSVYKPRLHQMQLKREEAIKSYESCIMGLCDENDTFDYMVTGNRGSMPDSRSRPSGPLSPRKKYIKPADLEKKEGLDGGLNELDLFIEDMTSLSPKHFDIENAKGDPSDEGRKSDTGETELEHENITIEHGANNDCRIQ